MPSSTSGLIAAWGTAHLAGQAPLDELNSRVLGHKSSSVRQSYSVREVAPWEEPVTEDEIVPVGDSITLGELLNRLRARGVSRLHAAFPVAGDADGIGPGPALAPAYAAGEAVLIEPLGLVLVPVGEDDESIELALYTSKCRAQHVSVSEATMELTEQLQHAAERLTDLDVASWNPRLGRVSRRAINETTVDPLPGGCPPRASHLLGRAGQLHTLLNAAAVDPGGGGVSSHEQSARDATLAPLRRAAARARQAAYNSVPYS